MEKKLLVLDIDGTLVNNEKEITPRTKDALIRAMEAGHSVMIASGRPTPGVQKYVDELRLAEFGGYTLTYNGARVQDCRTGNSTMRRPSCASSSIIPASRSSAWSRPPCTPARPLQT